MKWVVLAIAVVLVPYTYLTLQYRKPGPAFQPYQDMKQRANVARLLSAGYQRISLPAARPAESAAFLSPAITSAAPGGLPPDLGATLVEPPLLPLEILDVSVSSLANTLRDYPIQFTCTVPTDQQQLSGAEMYLREQVIVITPTFERVRGELRTRSRDSLVVVTVPAGALNPGSYHITLAGALTSRTWSVEVR